MSADLLPSFVRLILLLATNPRPARGDFQEARSALVAWFRESFPAVGGVPARGELAAHQRGAYPDGPAGARLYLVHAAGIVAEITSDAAPKTYRARFPAESASLAVGVALGAISLLERELDAEGLLEPVKEPATPDFSAADGHPCLASGCKEEAYCLRIWTGQGQEVATGPHGPYCQDHEDGRVEEWDYCGHRQGKRPACDRWAVRPPGFSGAVFCRLHGGKDYEGGSYPEGARAEWLFFWQQWLFFRANEPFTGDEKNLGAAISRGCQDWISKPVGAEALFSSSCVLASYLFRIARGRGVLPSEIRTIIGKVPTDLPHVDGFASYQQGASLVAEKFRLAVTNWRPGDYISARDALSYLWAFFVQFGGVDPLCSADKGGVS